MLCVNVQVTKSPGPGGKQKGDGVKEVRTESPRWTHRTDTIRLKVKSSVRKWYKATEVRETEYVEQRENNCNRERRTFRATQRADQKHETCDKSIPPVWLFK